MEKVNRKEEKIQRQTEGKERNKWEEMVEKATNEEKGMKEKNNKSKIKTKTMKKRRTNKK